MSCAIQLGLLLVLVHTRTPAINAVELPSKSIVMTDIGVSVDPDTFLLTYSDLSYVTINVALPKNISSDLPKLVKGCNLNDGNRAKTLKALDDKLGVYLNHLPKLFQQIEDHYCANDTLDCYLPENGTLVLRKKRFLPLVYVVGGIAASGYLIYSEFERRRIEEHLREVARSSAENQEWLSSVTDSTNRFKQLSNNVFQKLYHGELNDELIFAETICKEADASARRSEYYHFSQWLDKTRYSIDLSIQGTVTDFLIPSDFLQRLITEKLLDSGTIYEQDPGLFYTLTRSILSKYDPRARMLSFTVAIPIVKKMDTTVMYHITNHGWIKEKTAMKYKLPTYMSQLTSENKLQFAVATPDLDICDKKSGLYLCPLRGISLTVGTDCLHNILYKNSTNNCRVLTDVSKNICSHSKTKTGIFISGCEYYILYKQMRGSMVESVIRLETPQTIFLKYSEFDHVKIGAEIVKTRLSYQTTVSLPTTPIEVDLDSLKHLIAPGVEQDLTTLSELHLSKINTDVHYRFIGSNPWISSASSYLFWSVICIQVAINAFFLYRTLWKHLIYHKDIERTARTSEAIRFINLPVAPEYHGR